MGSSVTPGLRLSTVSTAARTALQGARSKKKSNLKPLIASVLAVPLASLLGHSQSASAAVSYWDINGAAGGAGGATPAGTWDTGTTANWSADPQGTVATTVWAA